MDKGNKFSMPNMVMQWLLIMFLVMTYVVSASAEEWSSSNIQILNGSGYELGDNDRTILTYEHSNRWAYGDNFFFLDATNPNSSGTSLYAELSPRFSISKISGKDASIGVIKDVFVVTSIEMGEELHTYLLGVGVTLNVDHFNYLNINLYLRQSHRDWVTDDTDSGGQVNINWGLPFAMGKSKWMFEGHLDYSFSEDGGSNPKEDNINAGPRLLVDIGNYWDVPGHLMAGIEYQIWRNKFGVDGINEDVAQLMMKWIF